MHGNKNDIENIDNDNDGNNDGKVRVQDVSHRVQRHKISAIA